MAIHKLKPNHRRFVELHDDGRAVVAQVLDEQRDPNTLRLQRIKLATDARATIGIWFRVDNVRGSWLHPEIDPEQRWEKQFVWDEPIAPSLGERVYAIMHGRQS